MKNNTFDIQFDPQTGCIVSLKHPADEHDMNWCSASGSWGKVRLREYTEYPKQEMFESVELPLIRFAEDEDACEAVYQNHTYQITVRRFFRGARLVENYAIKNIFHTVVTVHPDHLGFELPLPDSYTYADDCLIHHCNTHIWCGRHTAWVNALRMGPSKLNLGLVLTKGALDSYSQRNCGSNSRGLFVLNPASRMLKAGETYTFEWAIFWHEGKTDFLEKLKPCPQYIGVQAPHFTVFEGEPIRFAITTPNGQTPQVTCDGRPVQVEHENGMPCVTFFPHRTGKHSFWICAGNVVTHADFNVKIPFAELLKKRLYFIINHQQCRDPESPLDGAFLIYDNRTQTVYFDDMHSDHNACRERLNMSILMARYLQEKNDPKVREAMERFMRFIFREIYDETTGEVFNTVGKNRNALRLYNAPGVMLLFGEWYLATHDDRYLDHIGKLAENYYAINGHKCYSNAVAIARIHKAFQEAGQAEKWAQMEVYFRRHTDYMLRQGLSYPKHEVNYEQTIVTPAVTCLSEMGSLVPAAEQPRYREALLGHVECLDRFSGMQPSYLLHEIAIRYWDDFHFGKQRVMGDTLPQHLSCLSARAFLAYSRFTGEHCWAVRAEECIRNCLCLIDDDGHGHAAYVYPYSLNEQRGEFFDEWANDQDLPLYDALNAADRCPVFRI